MTPNIHVALLRAINVAGHAIVKMDAVRDAFSAAGCRNVATVIQSGNIVFELPIGGRAAILEKVQRNLRDLIGRDPDILFRTAREFERVSMRAPFKELERQTDVKLYVVFLCRKPAHPARLPMVSSKEALEAVAFADLEVFVVSRRKKNGFFGFPNAFIENALGVSATSRNWSTVKKLVEHVASRQ